MNLFEAIFAHDLAAPAIHFSGREISYGELRSATLQMAAAITSLGVQRGDRVGQLGNAEFELVGHLADRREQGFGGDDPAAA